jgi:hypothetical protein
MFSVPTNRFLVKHETQNFVKKAEMVLRAMMYYKSSMSTHVHQCPRCHYETDRKGNFIKHLSCKKTCPVVFEDVPVSTLLDDLKKPKQFQCDRCEHSYSHINALKRHQKAVHLTSTETHVQSNNNTCASHNTNHSHNHTTTNSHNINAPVSINLNFFGHESLDHVKNDPEFLTKCLKNVNLNGITDLLEKIHLNPTVPENINVKLKREHSPKTVYVYNKEQGGWTEMPADDVLHSMILKGVELLCIHKDDLFMIKQPLSPDDQDLCDSRTNKLGAIKKRARGSPYIPIKNSFIIKLRNHKKLSTKSSA